MRNFLATAAIAVGLAAGCKPEYPKCENDKDCKTAEFCVKGMCQLCRDDGDCARGKRCVSGRCDPIPGFCASAADCPKGQGCRASVCTACVGNEDCGEGGRCRLGTCLAPGECQSNEDCAANEECQGGQCVAPPAAKTVTGPCELAPAYFDFNESLLTSDAMAALAADADCLKKAGSMKARVEGHCDPRGTEDYNLALGDRRARSAIQYLSHLGADGSRLRPVSRGKLDAKGADEAGWKKDRRVDFFWE